MGSLGPPAVIFKLLTFHRRQREAHLQKMRAQWRRLYPWGFEDQIPPWFECKIRLGILERSDMDEDRDEEQYAVAESLTTV